MIVVRKAGERGRFDFGWLDTRHTFSFGDYHDPDHMGFRQLRVINEDRVAPGGGFPTHSHRDMEILSYVLEGAIEHQDSMGHREVLRPGELQRMSAGRGVTHSEYNPSREEPLHFLQIWILPDRRGLEPGYEQKEFPEKDRTGRLRLVAAPGGRDGALEIHQDVAVYATLLGPGQEVVHPLAPGRHAWVQVARGALEVGGRGLEAGDGAAISGEAEVRLRAVSPAEALLLDLG
ncbi:MAG: quercetin 2,3-dioxygenase [Acidobacteria bacterium]|nr:MAG: quercetin 2,3-dioxygenase [Acidobacteriota bacterium]